MTNLAIKGHVTRGKEVIEILEMLGGKNIYNYDGTLNECYVIDYKKICTIYTSIAKINGFVIITLEEFLEKFPYKIGDKVKDVRINDYIGIITNVRWDDNEEQIIYVVEWDDAIKSTLIYFAKDLQSYKEETMEERKYSDLRLDTDQDDKLATEATIDGNKITPPKNYLIGKITKVDNGMLVEFVKKQPQYPKTYKECCDVLSLPLYYNLRYYTYEHGYNEYATSNSLISLQDKLNTLGKLIICRDAYWKIAGEQMGLGKPWKPDWNDLNRKYFISLTCDGIGFYDDFRNPQVLAFPTEEMRNAFYENFKELIEECKELL